MEDPLKEFKAKKAQLDRELTEKWGVDASGKKIGSGFKELDKMQADLSERARLESMGEKVEADMKTTTIENAAEVEPTPFSFPSEVRDNYRGTREGGWKKADGMLDKWGKEIGGALLAREKEVGNKMDPLEFAWSYLKTKSRKMAKIIEGHIDSSAGANPVGKGTGVAPGAENKPEGSAGLAEGEKKADEEMTVEELEEKFPSRVTFHHNDDKNSLAFIERYHFDKVSGKLMANVIFQYPNKKERDSQIIDISKLEQELKNYVINAEELVKKKEKEKARQEKLKQKRERRRRVSGTEESGIGAVEKVPPEKVELKSIISDVTFQQIYNSIIVGWLKENGKNFDNFPKEEQDQLRQSAWIVFKKLYPQKAKEYEDAKLEISVDDKPNKLVSDSAEKYMAGISKVNGKKEKKEKMTELKKEFGGPGTEHSIVIEGRSTTIVIDEISENGKTGEWEIAFREKEKIKKQRMGVEDFRKFIAGGLFEKMRTLDVKGKVAVKEIEQELSPEERKEFEEYLTEASESWNELENALNWEEEGYEEEDKRDALVLQTKVYIRKMLLESSDNFKDKSKAKDVAQKIIEQIIKQKNG